MTFAKRLQNLRKSKNLSQPDLANIIDVSDRSISSWERGQKLPNTETTIKLADYFNVSADYLLCRDKKTADPKPDPNLISIQRAYEKLTTDDKEKMLEINKIMFKAAFAEEPTDDTI